jgi:hypothetical protein
MNDTSELLETASEKIRSLMHQRIDRYLEARSDPSLYQSVRNMSQFVSDDYGNRFLIELIQNAHDAHDPSRNDGEIAIVLTDEGDHGCLYIANRGQGFTWDNLKAITNIALSSKPVNAGIGNKGLGFRSVLQICDWPEIYSVKDVSGGASFDGYCFRFATEADLRKYMENDASEVAAEMALNMPCWHVPVPVESAVGEQVSRFSNEGFATVVRLPLKSKDAKAQVSVEIERLLAMQTPLHLFLSRITCVSIENLNNQKTRLERKILQAWHPLQTGSATELPIVMSLVRVGSDEFLLADFDIEEEVFRQYLNESLAKSQVPEAWRNWEGQARVSVSVPLGYALDKGTLYCFLPLGEEGRAPFAGYINANFYTKMDRRTVSDAIGLNKFFLQMAAFVSCRMVNFLIEQNWPQSPIAVVSLLCWDDAYIPAIQVGFGDEGRGILAKPLLPVRGIGNSIAWAPAESTYSWMASEDACLSVESIAEVVKAPVLLAQISHKQRAALDLLYKSLKQSDFPFMPSHNTIAEWIEIIASQMHTAGVAPERWADLYDECAKLLSDQPEALFGKRFLLSVGGDLISSEPPAKSSRGRKAADVYFSPVLKIDADSDDAESKRALPLERFPATLRNGFALLSREVPWLKEDGGYRPSRAFLLSAKLAREYDTGDVIRTLAAVTRSDVATRTREQALEWVFRLWNSARSIGNAATREAMIFVPTVSGWISTEKAMFGAGWNVPNGIRLQEFLKNTSETSADFDLVQSHLLFSYSAWPIQKRKEADWEEADWIRFLSAAGVTSCLRPLGGEQISSELIGLPWPLTSTVAAATNIPEPLRGLWRSQLLNEVSKMYTTRTYRAALTPWRLPGQNEFENLRSELKRDYAVQVALAIGELLPEHHHFRVVRIGASGSHFWPTPLRTFLTKMAWLPVSRPGSLLSFVKPHDAWLFGADDDRPPRFLDFIVPQVALVMNDVTVQWLRANAKLGIFNDPIDASRALGVLANAAAGGISDIQDVRRFQNVFRALWARARELKQSIHASFVPVLVGDAISAIGPKGGVEGQAIFIDQNDAVKQQLLKELITPMFDFANKDISYAWEWVKTTAPGQFRLISEESVEVFVNGTRFNETMQTRFITELIGPWIVDFFVCVAEHKGGSFVQATQNTLRKVRSATMNLSVVLSDDVKIGNGGERLPMPASLHNVVLLQTSRGPVLIVQTKKSQLTLAMLASMSVHIASALGARELAYGLEASLLRLSSSISVEGMEVPTDEIVAAAVGVDVREIKKTRQIANSDLSSLLHFAVPLAVCVGAEEAANLLNELMRADDAPSEMLLLAFESLSLEMGIPLQKLEVQLASLNDLYDLKDVFHLAISDLNVALEKLGNPYKSISNETFHCESWSRYLRHRQKATIVQLRQRSLGKFDRLESLESYVVARNSVLDIPADTGWFTVYDELPEAVMEAQISDWVKSLIPADEGLAELDDELSDCRSSNAQKFRTFWAKFGPILSAWVRLPGVSTSVSIRQTWTDPSLTEENTAAMVRDQGWLDFRPLDEFGIVKWLTREEIWPAGKVPSTELDYWGLSGASIENNAEQVQAEREEQKRRKTEVTFAGKTYSGLESGYADIAAAVSAEISSATRFLDIKASERSLITLEDAKPSGGIGGGNGPRRMPETGMSDIQKMAVGLIGELCAREWIRIKHGIEVDESIWVSSYRDLVLSTGGGNNLLGYDFAVASKSRTYYYEVKASMGDPRRFEMGPTEIGAALKYKLDREHRYRILYIAYATDPARTQATLLPNPFSAAGEDKLRAAGRGSVTYEFNPT